MPKWKFLPILLGVIVAALVAIILAVTFMGGQEAGPREVFQAHLLALDDGRLDDANTLVDITCGRVTEADLRAVKADLDDAGLTFQTAFRVSDVWLNERKTEAIVELDTPPNLPLPGAQGMMKVDGAWRLSCGS